MLVVTSSYPRAPDRKEMTKQRAPWHAVDRRLVAVNQSQSEFGGEYLRNCSSALYKVEFKETLFWFVVLIPF
jgi:hypothetical protein